MKHYRLNMAKFKHFVGMVTISLTMSGLAIWMLIAILNSPEW